MPLPNDQSSDVSSPPDYEKLFENSLCGILILSPKGAIIRANRKLLDWTGLEAGDIGKLRFSDLLPVGDKIYFETTLAPLLHLQGNIDEISLEFVCKDGTRQRVLVNAYEQRNPDESVDYIHLTAFKATDRQLYEENLREAKRHAEKKLNHEQHNSTLREQFVAVLGHDLRNPLGAMTSGAALLARSALSERDGQIVAMMTSSAARMLELIENVTDFARSRLGSGMLLSRETVNLKPVLQHVVDELQSAHPKRTIHAAYELTLPVYCDPARISQLLSNLLANALTHGAADTPVQVKALSDATHFELSVFNKGTPIPAETQRTLFQPFTRENSPTKSSGLGLGLYIVAEIARAHYGELSVASTDAGTVFSFKMGVG